MPNYADLFPQNYGVTHNPLDRLSLDPMAFITGPNGTTPWGGTPGNPLGNNPVLSLFVEGINNGIHLLNQLITEVISGAAALLPDITQITRMLQPCLAAGGILDGFLKGIPFVNLLFGGLPGTGPGSGAGLFGLTTVYNDLMGGLDALGSALFGGLNQVGRTIRSDIIDIEDALRGALDGIELGAGSVVRYIQKELGRLKEDIPTLGEITQPITGLVQDLEGLIAHFANFRNVLGNPDFNVPPLEFNLEEALDNLIHGRILPRNILFSIEHAAQTFWETWFGVRDPLLPPPNINDLVQAIQHIPTPNVAGIAGFTTLEDTINQTWGHIVAGIRRQLGIGGSPADIANAATDLANSTDTAVQLGEWNNAILGIRNDKSLMDGMSATEEANFPLSVLMGSSTPPLQVSATVSSYPMAFMRCGRSDKKGVISWLGMGVTSVTHLYVDLWKFDYTLNKMTCFHTGTADQIGQFSSIGWTYGQYFLNAIDRFDVNAGDVIGVSWRVVGTGTHYVAGLSTGSWIPDHPTVIPAAWAATTTSLSDIAFGSISYSNNLAWFGIDIVTGDVPAPYFAPRQTVYSDPGTYTYSIPSWANYIDGVILSGGSGGHWGDGGLGRSGTGGHSGTWAGETLVRGVDFPTGATTLTIVVGGGGDQTPHPGQDTYRVAITSGKAEFRVAGGTAPTGFDGSRGQSPGNFTFNGVDYTGGSTAYTGGGGQSGAPGSSPGGGGGGGSGGTYGVFWPGNVGAAGYASLTARQT